MENQLKIITQVEKTKNWYGRSYKSKTIHYVYIGNDEIKKYLNKSLRDVKKIVFRTYGKFKYYNIGSIVVE